MKDLSEVHGIDLIKRLAKEKIKEPTIKRRIWSSEMQSWGYFFDPPNEVDTFLIMGCCKPGDMFVALEHSPRIFNASNYSLINTWMHNPYVILELKFFEFSGAQVYALELLASNPPMICHIVAQQASLFKIAWSCLPDHAMLTGFLGKT